MTGSIEYWKAYCEAILEMFLQKMRCFQVTKLSLLSYPLSLEWLHEYAGSLLLNRKQSLSASWKASTQSVLLFSVLRKCGGVYGPYLFEEEGHVVIMNSPQYIQILPHFCNQTYCTWKLERMVQQGGATFQTVRNSMDVLRELFPMHLISLHGLMISFYTWSCDIQRPSW